MTLGTTGFCRYGCVEERRGSSAAACRLPYRARMMRRGSFRMLDWTVERARDWASLLGSWGSFVVIAQNGGSQGCSHS
jgi:hypothetical protein